MCVSWDSCQDVALVHMLLIRPPAHTQVRLTFNGTCQYRLRDALSAWWLRDALPIPLLSHSLQHRIALAVNLRQSLRQRLQQTYLDVQIVASSVQKMHITPEICSVAVAFQAACPCPQRRTAQVNDGFLALTISNELSVQLRGELRHVLLRRRGVFHIRLHQNVPDRGQAQCHITPRQLLGGVRRLGGFIYSQWGWNRPTYN